ncbi:unnamed protein product [Xylocopa violacea]|uniref:Uncharacterized protein n=1 Tax=Xylocopa violacea TaxID=135666 RepID=A0ABP1P4X3_XYLVO
MESRLFCFVTIFVGYAIANFHPASAAGEASKSEEASVLADCQQTDYRSYIKCLTRQKRHYSQHDHGCLEACLKKCEWDHDCDRRCSHCVTKTKHKHQIITEYDTDCTSGDCNKSGEIKPINVTTTIDIHNHINGSGNCCPTCQPPASCPSTPAPPPFPPSLPPGQPPAHPPPGYPPPAHPPPGYPPPINPPPGYPPPANPPPAYPPPANPPPAYPPSINPPLQHAPPAYPSISSPSSQTSSYCPHCSGCNHCSSQASIGLLCTFPYQWPCMQSLLQNWQHQSRQIDCSFCAVPYYRYNCDIICYGGQY